MSEPFPQNPIYDQLVREQDEKNTPPDPPTADRPERETTTEDHSA